MKDGGLLRRLGFADQLGDAVVGVWDRGIGPLKNFALNVIFAGTMAFMTPLTGRVKY